MGLDSAANFLLPRQTKGKRADLDAPDVLPKAVDHGVVPEGAGEAEAKPVGIL